MDFIELMETDINAAADQYATAFHEFVAVHLSDGITEAINDWFMSESNPGLTEDEARDLIHSAFSHKVNGHLAQHFKDAAEGWGQVFFTNVSEREGVN